MKWLAITGILLYLTRHSEAGALRCTPESQDPSCLTEKREILPLRSLIEREAETLADVECLAGSEWESNCHYCRCSDSGVAECLKQNSCDLDTFVEPIKCKPNTSFPRDCNTCTCLENGLGICTLRTCLQLERRKSGVKKRDTSSSPKYQSKSHVISKRGVCKPFQEFRINCNLCICAANGRNYACTLNECFEGDNMNYDDEVFMESEQPKSHVISKRGVCKPNQEFQIKCNLCKCASNGQTYACTHNECLEGDNMNYDVEVFMESEGSDHIERNSVCKPSDTFYIGCNTCHCNLYGTDYSCTNKPCPLPEDVELFHELKEKTTTSSNNTKQVVCAANRMFIMDCNTCWCNEDGTSFFCTRRVCLPGSNEENNTEEPNVENSTLPRKSRASQETPKACQPGQEFRMDCNKCLCNDEGQDFSCTRMDCAALNSNGGGDTFVNARSKREISEKVATECVPGSVFDRGCNVCRCTEDGQHATCTLKRCQRNKVATETEPTPSFRCTPGDQFKQGCNDCTCSADGNDIFCTLRFCDQDFTAI